MKEVDFNVVTVLTTIIELQESIIKRMRPVAEEHVKQLTKRVNMLKEKIDYDEVRDYYVKMNKYIDNKN